MRLTASTAASHMEARHTNAAQMTDICVCFLCVLLQVRTSAAAAASHMEARHADELAALRHKLQLSQSEYA